MEQDPLAADVTRPTCPKMRSLHAPHPVLPPDVRVVLADVAYSTPDVQQRERTEVVAPGSAARHTQMDDVDVRRVFDRGAVGCSREPSTSSQRKCSLA